MKFYYIIFVVLVGLGFHMLHIFNSHDWKPRFKHRTKHKKLTKHDFLDSAQTIQRYITQQKNIGGVFIKVWRDEKNEVQVRMHLFNKKEMNNMIKRKHSYSEVF